ncbi:MAG: mucoidy inhibitor MuiA family protein [Chloroflexi bacterium]|nr:mucoidy inhibitor MuiA family protein [Chloroflexota bacterium]
MPATPLEAPIGAVTVFINLARITRRGRIMLEAGEHTLVIGQLPDTLQEESVRASGRGEGLKILGVEAKTEFTTVVADVNELIAHLEALQDSDRLLLQQDEVQKHRLEFLKTLREQGALNFAKTLAYSEAQLKDATGFAAYVAEQTETIHAERHKIQQARRTLEKEIKVQQARIARRSSQTNAERTVQVSVLAGQAGEIELEIEYVVQGAWWTPLYDVRLGDNDVTLTYLAEIRQTSGEDWPPVPLALSTAKPATSARLPELEAWYVDALRPPIPAARAARLPMQTKAAFENEGLAAADAEYEADKPAFALPDAASQAEIAQATIEASGASVTYRVEKPVSVPADGTPYKATVTVQRLAVKLDYLSVPKLAEEAYLRATITNTSDYLLLPGSAAIYHGADFVGKTQLDLTAPNEEFQTQLGVDDRVRITRELLKRDVGKTLIGNTRRTAFSYKISVHSLLPHATKISVSDHLPVSRHEQIKVKLSDATPEPAQHNDLNILQWTLDLNPQHKREIIYSFTVEHPREMTVIGLD